MTENNVTPFDDWIRLTDSPFLERCALPPLFISNDRILKSPNYEKYLYIFDTKMGSWSKYPFNKDYKAESHGVCLSNDKEIFYSYHGHFRSKSLLIFDLKKMKHVKIINNLLESGKYPNIIPDPYKCNIIHLIGGEYNDKHLTINTDDGEINTLYSFDKISKRNENFGTNGIIHIKYKNIWIYVSGDIPIQIYDYINNKWTNTEIEIPEMYKWFSYILTNDEKYILIFAGVKYDKNVRKWIHCSDIKILDVETMEYVSSIIKCPVITGCYNFSKQSNAIITNQGWIHLFVLENMNLSVQWKIHINKIIKSSNVLINGYLKKNKIIYIPNQIINDIIRFHGDIIIQHVNKKKKQEFIYQDQLIQIKRIWSFDDDKDDLIKKLLLERQGNVTAVHSILKQ